MKLSNYSIKRVYVSESKITFFQLILFLYIRTLKEM